MFVFFYFLECNILSFHYHCNSSSKSMIEIKFITLLHLRPQVLLRLQLLLIHSFIHSTAILPGLRAKEYKTNQIELQKQGRNTTK